MQTCWNRASPHVVTEYAGHPLLAAVVEAERALREIGLREEVDLVVSGGIRTGADAAKVLALGADAVAVSTGVLIAMGYRQYSLCMTGRRPYGIATQDPILRRRLNVEKATFIEELRMFSQLAGKTSTRNLEKEDLRALTLDVSAITDVKLVGAELSLGEAMKIAQGLWNINDVRRTLSSDLDGLVEPTFMKKKSI